MNAVNAQPEQRNTDWYTQRKGRITASRVGAILGLSKYRTRHDVMRAMVREALDAEPEFVGNEATRYGEAHEADAINAYEQRFGALVEPCGLVVHPLYNWAAASPDGLVGKEGLLEAKCPYRAQYTDPSAEYIAQMQWQMECTGRAWVDFAVWREGEPLAVTRVSRDPHWLDANIQSLRDFANEYQRIIADKELAVPYLTDKDRVDAEWQAAVHDYLECADAAAKCAQFEKDARQRLIDMAPQGAKGCGVQVIRSERAGTIRYADALKSMLPDVDLSPWRGKSSITYQIRICK